LGDGLVIVGSEDGIVYAFQQEDGAAQWHFPTGDRVWSTPTTANGRVYFGSMDGNLYAVATIGETAGKKVWSFDTGAAVVTQPLVLDDMVVFGALNKKFYGLDLEGNLLWTFEGDDWFWAAPVGVDGVVYASTMSGRVYALDRDGNELWPRPFNAGSPIVSRPALLDNRLVVGTDEGRLFLLDSSDGTNVHDTPKLDGRIKADLTVHQDSDDGKVFVFLGLDDSTIRRFEVRAGVDLLEPDWVFKP
jgi:outer membrane protein assembly factor BamB